MRQTVNYFLNVSWFWPLNVVKHYCKVNNAFLKKLTVQQLWCPQTVVAKQGHSIDIWLYMHSFKVLSNSSIFPPSCQTFQVAYLNRSTIFIYELPFGNNPSGFFSWYFPVERILPEWVVSPEQGKSSGTIATFSFWTFHGPRSWNYCRME